MTRYGTLPVLILLIVFALAFAAPEVLAQSTPCPAGSGCIDNPLKATTISGFLRDLFRAVVKIGLPIVTLFIVWSGFLFVKARGSSTELTKAKQNFTYVILGTTIFLGAWAIAEMIAATLRQLGV